MRRVRWWLAAVVVTTAACSDGAAAPRAQGAPLFGSLTVLAAASLTEAFTELGRVFEDDHPGIEVRFSFGASSSLAQQALGGAPADLLATADEESLQKVVEGGDATDPRVFARNRLSILVATGNPRGVAALRDLARPEMAVVLCAPEVPCGRFSAEALQKAGVMVTPKSWEENVKGVVAKIRLGEADAGLVYVTDARAADDKAEVVGIPVDHNVIATYPVAVLRGAANPQAARAFRDLLLSPAGQQILVGYGFLAA